MPDTFHDYELCILAQHLREILKDMVPLDMDFISENRLMELYQAARVLPGLKTGYIPRDSIVREFIGGSRYEY